MVFDTVRQGNVIINKKKKTFKLKDAQKKTYKKKHRFIKGVANLSTMGMASAVGAISKAVTTKEYSFTDLVSAELYEDDSSVSSVSIGSALMFGIFAKRKTKKIVHNLSVLVTVNDLDNPSYAITFISKKTKTKSKKYKKAMNQAQKTLNALNVILNETSKIDQLQDDVEEYSEDEFNDEIEDSIEETIESIDIDPYEELKKLKELLDMGIISQEEYDQKKKELLGL